MCEVTSNQVLRQSYRSDTMLDMKVAISLPDSVFEAAELLAEELHIPRSQLYAEALSAYLDAHGGAAITTRLNEVHGETGAGMDPALAYAQWKAVDRETW